MFLNHNPALIQSRRASDTACASEKSLAPYHARSFTTPFGRVRHPIVSGTMLVNTRGAAASARGLRAAPVAAAAPRRCAAAPAAARVAACAVCSSARCSCTAAAAAAMPTVAACTPAGRRARGAAARRGVVAAASSKPTAALIFDCDGVIVETEELHRWGCRKKVNGAPPHHTKSTH